MPELEQPDIYEQMQLPEESRLDEKIPKNLFYQQPKFSKSDEKLFTKDIEKIILRYSLTPDNTHLATFKDEIRDYEDLLIIEIDLRQASKRERIAELFWQYLPRPQMIVFKFDNSYEIAMALVRTNQADNTRNTVEESLTFSWLEETDEFWRRMDYTAIPARDFYQLYHGWFDRLSQEKARRELSRTDVDGTKARQILARVSELTQQIELLRAQLKKETQFNRQVELNMQIKKLEQDVLRERRQGK